MFGWLGKVFGNRTAVEAQRSNPVVEAAVKGSAEAYAKLPLAGLIDEARRSKLARDLYLEISRICNTTDPKTTCREELAAMMQKSAGFQVLVIPPLPQPDDSGLRDQPGVTGELKADGAHPIRDRGLPLLLQPQLDHRPRSMRKAHAL